MFFCERCRSKWRWPKSIVKLLSRCEVCNRSTPCWEVPAKNLYDPIGVIDQEVKDREADAGAV